MSNRNINPLVLTVVFILVILIGGALLNLIVNVIRDSRNNCQLTSSSTKKKNKKKRITNDANSETNNETNNRINSLVSNISSKSFKSEYKNNDEILTASLMLSNDKSMATYTINYINPQPFKLKHLAIMSSSGIGNINTSNAINSTTHIVKCLKCLTSNIQVTEEGFIINGMWTKFGEEPLTDEIISELGKNIYVEVEFEDHTIKSLLLYN